MSYDFESKSLPCPALPVDYQKFQSGLFISNVYDICLPIITAVARL